MIWKQKKNKILFSWTLQPLQKVCSRNTVLSVIIQLLRPEKLEPKTWAGWVAPLQRTRTGPDLVYLLRSSTVPLSNQKCRFVARNTWQHSLVTKRHVHSEICTISLPHLQQAALCHQLTVSAQKTLNSHSVICADVSCMQLVFLRSFCVQLHAWKLPLRSLKRPDRCYDVIYWAVHCHRITAYWYSGSEKISCTMNCGRNCADAWDAVGLEWQGHLVCMR